MLEVVYDGTPFIFELNIDTCIEKGLSSRKWNEINKYEFEDLLYPSYIIRVDALPIDIDIMNVIIDICESVFSGTMPDDVVIKIVQSIIPGKDSYRIFVNMPFNKIKEFKKLHYEGDEIKMSRINWVDTCSDIFNINPSITWVENMVKNKEVENMTLNLDENKIGKIIRDTLDITKKEENTMMKPVTSIKVTDVKNYNDRAVLTYFNDGTFTKAICSENDNFDLDVGIQVCMMKKIFGTSGYYKLMKDIHKQIDYNNYKKESEKELRKELRDKQKKREEKAAAKRQANIDAYKNDITDAVLKAIKLSNEKIGEDDLK